MAAATVTAVGLVQTAGASGGTSSVFIPITPCRLLDTRAGSDNVGARATPLGSGEAATFTVWGTNGNCTIPNTATGIATNATAVNPTSSSYITFYPADATPRPTASNLNFVAGSAPTPNQVTVGLSATGSVGIYNLTGTVDIIVDIVGYYSPAPSGGVAADVYTKAQVDALLATKQSKPTGGGSYVFTGAGWSAGANSTAFQVDVNGLQTSGCMIQRLSDLPDGATVTLLSYSIKDPSAAAGPDLTLYFRSASSAGNMAEYAPLASVTGQVNGGTQNITNAVIDNRSRSYYLQYCVGAMGISLAGGSVDYELP